jgi:hypothetical protein
MGVLFAFFAVSGGKVYYVAGLFPVLVAAGAVAISRRGRRRLLMPTVVDNGIDATPRSRASRCGSARPSAGPGPRYDPSSYT